ncbi:alpha/beta fold hydrolase [Lolliginicoccus suaedae]|uniref:alpha/beta fold hydrolase n=1 Tax=Lolliginicoccus suaedae TaxID=2605429 RepID=UPI0011EFADB6|nr:alpha/beta hydrolase [Lolliginicoccus suaedae]
MSSLPPIVLVHGIRLSHAEWTAETAQLREHGYRVDAVDLPGHGSRRGQPFTLDGAIEVITRSIDAHGEPALLVGHSLGGYLALAAAARHPDLLAGLVVTGSTAIPSKIFAAPFLGGYHALNRLPNRGDTASQIAMRLTAPPPAARAIIDNGIATEVIPDVVRDIVAFDPLAAARSYPGPTWYINGRHDHFRIHERRFLRASRDNGRAAELRIVPGAGHYLPLTHAAVFTTHLEGIAAGIRG